MDDLLKTTTKPFILKLDQLYEVCVKQTEPLGFFTHLYRYLNVIFRNKDVTEIILRHISSDFEDDYPKINFSFTRGRPDNSTELTRFVVSHLIAVQDHKGAATVYNCWTWLMSFYYCRAISPSTAQTAPFDNKDFVDMFADVIQELDNIYQRNDDSENSDFTRSKYVLYTEVFHSSLMEWLSDEIEQQSLPASGALPQFKVSLKFGDYPIITNLYTNQQYEARELITPGKRAFEIVRWLLLNKEGQHIKEDKLSLYIEADRGMINKNINISSRGVKDDIHKSIFNPGTGLLGAFITIDTKKNHPDIITVKATAHMSEKQFARVINDCVLLVPKTERFAES